MLCQDPPRPQLAPYPLPLRERVSECASRSSLHLPDRRAVFLVLELDSHRIELVANLIRYLEVLRLACGVAGVDQCYDLVVVYASTLSPQDVLQAHATQIYPKETARCTQGASSLKIASATLTH